MPPSQIHQKRWRRLGLLIIFCMGTSAMLLYNANTWYKKANHYEDVLLNLDHIETCVPKKNIVFLKTHKCASSAIQNIFLRYGDTHKLVFALPSKTNYLGHPLPFKQNMVPSLKTYNFTYNILTHHSRLNYPEMKNLMPPHTVFVTIVRDPVTLFESMFSYYDFQRHINKSLSQLVTMPRAEVLLKRRVLRKFGLDQMLYDLGFQTRAAVYGRSSTAQYIKYLDRIFDLVMVAERMDESLILLKHLLCWDTDDVITFKLNTREQKFKTNLSESIKANILRLNKGDSMLYDYFVQRLEQRVEEFGVELMAKEIEELNNRTDYWYSNCVEEVEPLKKLLNPKKYYVNAKVMSFKLKKNDTFCEKLTLQELVYTEKLRKRQAFFYPKPTVKLRSYKSPRRIKNGRLRARF